MPHVARRGGIGALLQTVLDEQGLSQAGFAARLTERYGGSKESWRSQVGRILKGQRPTRTTAMRFAEALEKPADFFLPPADPEIVDTALLTQIVTRLEEDPSAASGDLAPLLVELADQLAELSFRLRQAVARTGERWRRG